MTENDRPNFFLLIADVYAFYQKHFSDFVGKVWWEAMKSFDFDAVSQALSRHAANPDVGQYLPKPADVVRMLQGSTQDSALVAWSKVDRAVRVVGTHRSVVFDDPLIHRVVTEMGGWVALGTKDEKEWPFQQNEFVNRYRGYRSRSEVLEYPPVLAGIAESGNNQTPGVQHREPPMLVGDRVKAQQVLLFGTGGQMIKIGPASTKDLMTVRVLTNERKSA
jgi:Domain of unknown function (DUF6475)